MSDDRAWVGTRKGLFELRKAASGWRIHRVSFLSEPVSALAPPDASGRMFAALSLGHFGAKLHASDDGGETWQEMAAPVYPPQPEDAPGPAWTLVQVWTLDSVLDTQGQPLLLAGTLPGGLFQSADRGASWQLVESLWQRPERAEWFGGGYDTPGIHSISQYPGRPGEWLVSVSCGGVWHTTDAGAGWSLRTEGLSAAYMPPERANDPRIQDPHRIARCAGSPEVLWCQHHNGLWRSADNALSWQELTSAPVSKFGFAVAAHPRDPLTAWTVPAVADERRIPVDAAFAVQRTRDGGQSFEALREGLPQADCYDLVYRHGLDVAADGRHLLMGSTTGHLWASANGGDDWQSVAAHLPPIYALKFG
ncbi:MAG TPA: exo-alpha-sialidase [Ideonella sp.]|nr:exo-alpha-sialidase [Ideonella sp.]